MLTFMNRVDGRLKQIEGRVGYGRWVQIEIQYTNTCKVTINKNRNSTFPGTRAQIAVKHLRNYLSKYLGTLKKSS
jgi:hypothetical protein